MPDPSSTPSLDPSPSQATPVGTAPDTTLNSLGTGASGLTSFGINQNGYNAVGAEYGVTGVGTIGFGTVNGGFGNVNGLGSNGDGDGDGDGDGNPVILDLTGKGIKVTPLTSSNTFVKLGNDGYAHHTAWAAAGNAVLFYDPKNTGAITESNQVVFTQWDPTASSDMQALRDVFDTNHNGKLDSGDAGFASFKVMVTNADGTTTVETLAQAGITSINLIPTNANVTQVDGSTVTGQTTFTKSDGTIGAAADVTLAYDVNGYVVKQVVTKNADGSTTVDNKAYNPSGDLASDATSTTSANGLTRTLVYDDNGDGVTDRKQTIVTVNNAGGSQTETLSDFGDGGTVLTDHYITTTSADGKSVSISRDLNGGGIVQQTETRITASDGSSADTLTYVNQDRSSRGSRVISISADGLTKTTKTDTAGSGTFDLTTTDATVVASDGSRTETVNDTNSNGSLRDQTITTISANGQTKTVKQDQAGSGTYNLMETSATVTNSDNSTTTTVNDTSANGTLLEKLVTTISADGLTKKIAIDVNGDGIIDQTTGDVTVVNADGSRTETVQIVSNYGVLLSQVTTVKGADGQSRTITTDTTGDGKPTSKEVISVAANGTSTDDLQHLNADGSLINRVTTTTSADGLTKTTAVDMDGNGTVDQTVVDATVHNVNGTSTETVTTTNNDGSLVKKVVTSTSADDLTKTIQRDVDGNGTIDVTTTDATVVNSDGSLAETISATSTNGTLLTKSVFNTSADKRTLTVTNDAGGDGFTSKGETVSVANNGTVMDTTTDYAQNGSKIDQAIVTTSANRLNTTIQTDSNGDGTFDLSKADATVINADGSRTETVTDTVANGGLRDKTVTTTSANGLTKTTAHDYDGNGTIDLATKDATVFNADGSTTETVSDTNNNASLRDTTITTKSANGLSTTVTHDFDGDGTVDLTTTDVTVLKPDGSKTETLTNTNVHGQRDQSVATTSADRRTTTVKRSFTGSVNYTETEVTNTADNGATTDTLSIFAAAGALLTTVAVTTSANGMTQTVQADVDGDGTFDLTSTDATAIAANGTKTETVTKTGSGGTLISKSVTTTTANGLSKTVQADVNGDGTFDATTTDVTSFAPSGIQTEIVTDTNANGSVRDTAVTTTSADRRTVTVAMTYGSSDGSQSDTKAVQQDGSTIETVTSKAASGSVLGTETVTTSATGLTKTTVFQDGSGKTLDNQSDATVLNNDGSRTETFTDADRGITSSKVVTTTSANGLVKSIQTTLSGVGSMNVATSDVTTMNADGSNAETITDTSGSTTLDTLSMTLSANALTKTFSLDENGDGKADIADTTAYATDGSKSETTIVTNTATQAQQEKDVITTSADGRTTTLQSARNGDANFDHFEATVINADNSVTDTSWVTNPTNAPNYWQSRTQQFNPDGSQTITVENDVSLSGGSRKPVDWTTTTISATELVKTSTVSLSYNTGETPDFTTSDVTTLNSDGSKSETINEIGAFATSLPNKGVIFDRNVTTSADGRTITTKVDNDGNGIFEAVDIRTTNADGSVTDVAQSFNNLNGVLLTGTALDGSAFTSTTDTTSADGLLSISVQGGVTSTKTILPGANGSYQWTEVSSQSGTIASASHMIDANKVDTWTSTTGGTSTAIRIDLAGETKAIGQADAIYRVALGRSISDAESQSLVKYIIGGVLNQTQLATDLLGGSEFAKKYGTLNDALFTRLYENAFGHLPDAYDLTTYLGQLAAQTTTAPAIVVAVAQKMVDESAGNGLLQLLPGAPTEIPTSVSLIPTANQALSNMGTSYQQFVASFPAPSASLTSSQINLFVNQVYGSSTGVVTNQGTNRLTAKSSDGTSTDLLLYDTNQIVDATTSSYKAVVDVGSNNTLRAGANSGVMLVGGASDTLVGGAGTSTLLALGANEKVTTGTSTTNATTVQASGDGTTVNAATGKSNILLSGASTNLTVSGATSNTSIDVSSAGAHLSGTSSNITIEGSAVVDISGSGNSISTAGGSPTIAVNGSNNTVTADTGALITINGTGETVAAHNANVTLSANASASLNGNNNIVTQMSGAALTMTGQSGFIDVKGTGAVDTIAHGQVVVGTGASATINGDSNIIIATSQAGATVTGSVNSVTAMSGSTITDAGNSNLIDAKQGGSTLNLSGSGSIAQASNDAINVYGSGFDSVAGSGNTVTLYGGAVVPLTGSNNTITFGSSKVASQIQINSLEGISQKSDGSIQLAGFTDPTKVIAANGKLSLTLAYGPSNTNDKVTVNDIPGVIDDYDTVGGGGLHRWEELYDAASGALKETDQYRYNASNQLVETDRYNGSHTMTEADFFNPSTSAAIGSYLYGTGGVVNEVVDLVNNHDWLRNTNGTYTDKTSGATSQTQPTINHS